jgi:hypothetical protein
VERPEGCRVLLVIDIQRGEEVLGRRSARKQWSEAADFLPCLLIHLQLLQFLHADEVEAGFARLPMGRFREQGRLLEDHRRCEECLVGSQRRAYASRLQMRVALGRVIVHRVISNNPLVQAERGILLPSLLGCPSLPVEHLRE